MFPCTAVRQKYQVFLLALTFGCGQPKRPAPLAASPTSDAPAAATVVVATDPTPVPEREAGAEDATANEPPGDMILVPAGPFTMGADQGGQEDEHPAHTVTLAAYWLDKNEVTNEAYERCVAAKVCRPPDPKSAEVNHFGSDQAFRAPRQPISSISWDDAKTFCGWLGKRLPTEAEWEKAARGTDGRKYPWGNEPPDETRGVFASNRTADVGSRPNGAGPFGHLDMAGNVWEWLEDIYDPYAYGRPRADRGIPGSCAEVLAAQDELRRKGSHGYTGTNPIPTECEHALRGGAFNYGGPGLRSSNRVHHPGHFRLIMSGVRCAKDDVAR